MGQQEQAAKYFCGLVLRGTPAILPIITALKNGESITFEGKEVSCAYASVVALPLSLLQWAARVTIFCAECLPVHSGAVGVVTRE